MRLVKGGRVVEDRFVRVLDDAPIPDGVPVLIPAARFLADASEIVAREAPTGILWPNNRRVAEFAPHLDRLALVALTFPAFKDGRAYSQARLIREHYGFRGELRATGDVLRDQLCHALTTILYSQARAFVPAWNWSKLRHACSRASCTRSSAIVESPVKRRANRSRPRVCGSATRSNSS